MMDPETERTPDLGPEPWFQLDKKKGGGETTETDMAYAAFRRHYLSPPGERNLRELAKELGKHRTQMDVWSKRFYWPLRVAAWDRRQSEIAAAQEEQRMRAREELRVKRKADLNEERNATGQQLREFAMQGLTNPRIEKKMEKTEGSSKQTIVIKPMKEEICLEMLKRGFEMGEHGLQQSSLQTDAATAVDDYVPVPYQTPAEEDK
jgi:hypothetical protein